MQEAAFGASARAGSTGLNCDRGSPNHFAFETSRFGTRNGPARLSNAHASQGHKVSRVRVCLRTMERGGILIYYFLSARVCYRVSKPRLVDAGPLVCAMKNWSIRAPNRRPDTSERCALPKQFNVNSTDPARIGDASVNS